MTRYTFVSCPIDLCATDELVRSVYEKRHDKPSRDREGAVFVTDNRTACSRSRLGKALFKHSLMKHRTKVVSPGSKR